MKGNNNTDSNNQQYFYTETQEMTKHEETTDSNNQQYFCTETQEMTKHEETTESTTKIVSDKKVDKDLEEMLGLVMAFALKNARDNREASANIDASKLLDGMQKNYFTNKNIVAGSGCSNRSNCFKRFWDYICCCRKHKKTRSNEKFEYLVPNKYNTEMDWINAIKTDETNNPKVPALTINHSMDKFA